MRVVLDACVLFPSVMRAVLMAVAGTKAFQPVWSDRLLEEWVRAADRQNKDLSGMARVEVALLQDAWPDATYPTPENLQEYWLPDADDRHVLALAVQTGADHIITLNLKDFPAHFLQEYDLTAIHPDAFLVGYFRADPQGISDAISPVLDRALADLSDFTPRKLMKKARLPRLGKAIEASGLRQ